MAFLVSILPGNFFLVDVSDIFYFFPVPGRGKGRTSGQKFPTQPVDRSTPKLLRSFPAIHSIWSKHPDILKRTLEVFVQLLTFVCLHGCHHGGFLSSFFIGQMCHGSGLPRLSLIALNA